MTISDTIKANVRAVLLSKTDGSGVLVSTFLRDYKSIIGEPLMYKNMGYTTLEDFIKDLSDVCRLNYSEKDMAYRLFGIAKPNTYASSFMKRAEGNNTDEGSAGRGKRKSSKGEKLQMNNNLDEEWQPNGRGHFSLCFPNKPNSGLNGRDEVAMKFAPIGEVAEINIIPRMIFVRYKNQADAKKAIQMFGKSLGLRRADERNRGETRGEFKSSDTERNMNNSAKFSTNSDDDWDDDPQPVVKVDKKPVRDKTDSVLAHRETTEKVQVYVGNLPADINENQLVSLFSPYDNIGVRLKHQSGNKTYAFVDFTSVPEAIKMINDLHETVVNGRNMKIRFANQDFNNSLLREREGDALSPKSNSSSSPKGSIERQFEQLAVHRGSNSKHQHGENITRTITRNDVQRNSQPGGYPHTANAISPSLSSHTSGGSSPNKMPPLENIDNRNGYDNHDMPPLETIQPKSKKNKRGQGQSSRVKDNIDADMPPLEKTQLPIGTPEHMPKIPDYGASAQAQPIQLFIGNFPYGTREDDLFDLLAPYGIINLMIMNKETTNRSTYAFATCRDLMHAEKAIEDCDQSFYRGRRLTVTLANPISQLSPASSSNSSLNYARGPLANITCTVGGDAGRQVHLEGHTMNGPMQQQFGADNNYSSHMQAYGDNQARYSDYPQSYDNSQGRKTDYPQSYDNSQGRKTDYPQSYDNSQGRNTEYPQSHDNSQGRNTDYPQSYDNSQGRNTDYPQSYDNSQGRNSDYPQSYDNSQGRNNRYPQTYDRSEARNKKYPQSYDHSQARNQQKLTVKNDINLTRLTCILKNYGMIVSKLRGDDRYNLAVGTNLAVMVTDVVNDKFFWGQIIQDSEHGENGELQKLMEVSEIIQDDVSRSGPIKGLGRCSAVFNGEWFRAWCTHIMHRDGQEFCDLLYVDYGNTEQVPKTEVFCTNQRINDIWCLPPMARPFKLTEHHFELESLTNKVIVCEVTESGASVNNFLTTVIGKFDQ